MVAHLAVFTKTHHSCTTLYLGWGGVQGLLLAKLRLPAHLQPHPLCFARCRLGLAQAQCTKARLALVPFPSGTGGLSLENP